MRLFRDNSLVPVLMFHSIGNSNPSWVWSELTESAEDFERIISGIADRGFATVGLQELHEHMSGSRRLPDKSIVITLDDGYLDNWTIAAPILRKFGMRAVVYITPEFVDESEGARPTMDDVNAGRVSQSELETSGFMNWHELKAANDEGVLDVQCHGLTHTWYFSGPKIVDVHRPASIYRFPWMSWNARPDRKPYYLSEEQQHFVPWGQPVFEHEKSMIVKRFTPDDQAVDEIIDYVHSNGEATYFSGDRWREDLHKNFSCLRPGSEFPGTYETEGAYVDRVTHELSESKRLIEERLGKVASFLSWPGGGNTPLTNKLAFESGFKSYTLSSWQEPFKRNGPNVDPGGIKRISGHTGVFWRNRQVADGGADWVVGRILTHQGSVISRLLGAGKKVVWALGALIHSFSRSGR